MLKLLRVIDNLNHNNLKRALQNLLSGLTLLKFEDKLLIIYIFSAYIVLIRQYQKYRILAIQILFFRYLSL